MGRPPAMATAGLRNGQTRNGESPAGASLPPAGHGPLIDTRAQALLRPSQAGRTTGSCCHQTFGHDLSTYRITRRLPTRRGVRFTIARSVSHSVAVRFSEGFPSPHKSTTVHQSRPDDLLRHLGVQDRPHVSTTVVSTALATDLRIRRPLTFRSRSGESSSRGDPP